MVIKEHVQNYQLQKVMESFPSFLFVAKCFQVKSQCRLESSALPANMRTALPEPECPDGLHTCEMSSRVGNTLPLSCEDTSGGSALTTRLQCIYNTPTCSNTTSSNTTSSITSNTTSSNTSNTVSPDDSSKSPTFVNDKSSQPGNCYSIVHRKEGLRLEPGYSRVSESLPHDISIAQCPVSCYQTLLSRQSCCDKKKINCTIHRDDAIVSPCGYTENYKYNSCHRNDVKNNLYLCTSLKDNSYSCLDSFRSVQTSTEPNMMNKNDGGYHKTDHRSSNTFLKNDNCRVMVSTLLVVLLLAAGSASPVSPQTVNRRLPANTSTLNNVRTSPEKYDYHLSPRRNSSSLDTSSSLRPGYPLLNATEANSSDFDGFLISSYTGPPTSRAAAAAAAAPTSPAAAAAAASTSPAAAASNDVSSYKHTSRTLDADSNDIYSINGIYADQMQQLEDFDDFDAALLQPITHQEDEKIRRFDPTRLNYTALRIMLDGEMEAINRRQGRFFDSYSYAYRLPRFLTHLGRMLDIETVINEIETSIMTSVSCNACKGGVGLLQHYIEQGKTKEDIVRAASKLCTNFRVETPRVCFGIIQLMSDEVVYVMENLVMEPDGICGFLIGDVCGIPHDPYHKWRVLFPPYPKPPVPLIKPPKEEMPTYKVLHLSDTHFDPYYEEGSNAECNEPMCCRRTSGTPKTEAARAGKWGDYRKCDTPERTIKSMFENIAHMHPDIDYILWTGDLPPHDIWNQTRDSNLLVLRETVQQLFDYFPNTPVFPALGNHESAPVNSFPPPSIPAQHSVQWLYNELEKQWRRWLPAYTSPTILKGGYYSVEVVPGFRIVSLNMNYCNNKNWWLLLDSEDPADQLQWLVYELQAAELKNEKVHIIGHIPPGYHDCLRVWSHNFYTIVNRFEMVITSQFYGHTHFDEFELFYDPYRRYRVTNVAYIAPSQTSYYQLNPGYRLYKVQADFNGSEKRVVDHETWVMNLDDANHPNNVLLTPRWYRLYSARSAYDMRSLLPADWDNLVYRMVEDEGLFKMFYRHYWKNSPMREDCDSECKKRILCDLRSGRSNDRAKTCAVVHQRVEAQERSQWRTWIFSGFTVPFAWIKRQLGF